MFVKNHFVSRLNKIRYLSQVTKLIIFGDINKPNEKKLPPQITKNIYKSENITDAINVWLNEKKELKSEFTLKDLGEEIHINEKELSFYFSKCLNTSFKLWKHKIKLNLAKNLLINMEDKSISEIINLSGFKEESNFYRQFKKNVGCTPKEWRDCKGNLNLL